jgi:putative ABC transport system permease protein
LGKPIFVRAVVVCSPMIRGSWTSLHRSRDLYYQRYRFADVTAHLKRAPESVANRMRERC